MLAINIPIMLHKKKKFPKNTFNYYVKNHFAVMTLVLTAARKTVETLAEGVSNVQI